MGLRVLAMINSTIPATIKMIAPIIRKPSMDSQLKTDLVEIVPVLVVLIR